MAAITYAQAASVLKYEPETGRMFWLKRNGRGPAAGREALTALNRGGYKRGHLLGVSVRAHQVAWLFTHGEWPADEIDHVNGDKTDNRPENLRLVTRAQNMRNTAKPITNTSGHVGVSWHKRAGKWEAHIEFCGKKKHLGLFSDLDAAVSARKYAAGELGFHENHGR